MQLMPGTAEKLGVTDSFSPEQNVHGGAHYLRELLERYHGDAVKALAAYNAGPGAVDRYQGVPPYRETRLYVQRVVRDYNKKKERAGRNSSAGNSIPFLKTTRTQRRAIGQRFASERQPGTQLRLAHPYEEKTDFLPRCCGGASSERWCTSSSAPGGPLIGRSSATTPAA